MKVLMVNKKLKKGFTCSFSFAATVINYSPKTIGGWKDLKYKKVDGWELYYDFEDIKMNRGFANR